MVNPSHDVGADNVAGDLVVLPARYSFDETWTFRQSVRKSPIRAYGVRTTSATKGGTI